MVSSRHDETPAIVLIGFVIAPARVLVLPVVSELRPVDRSRVRVRRREELHRGGVPRPAFPGLPLEHRGHHRAVARRGIEKQKAAWGEKLAEMKSLDIEYHADWAAKAK